MPNHVINMVSITGEQDKIREMLESIQNDEKGFGTIDFNKIIPMPESMNIEAGSNTYKGLEAYAGFIQIYTLAGTREDADMEHIPKEAEEAFLRMRKDITPAQWELGKTAYENQSKYGAPTWYEWAISKWGTKWNAYDCVPCDVADDHTELCFLTAWSAPYPVLRRLSAQYPELSFSHEWADEDIGVNCGRHEYSNGCFMEEFYPKGDDAAAFAYALWDREPPNETDEPMTMGGVQQ